jgi:hypothetical protein
MIRRRIDHVAGRRNACLAGLCALLVLGAAEATQKDKTAAVRVVYVDGTNVNSPPRQATS